MNIIILKNLNNKFLTTDGRKQTWINLIKLIFYEIFLTLQYIMTGNILGAEPEIYENTKNSIK